MFECRRTDADQSSSPTWITPPWSPQESDFNWMRRKQTHFANQLSRAPQVRVSGLFAKFFSNWRSGTRPQSRAAWSLLRVNSLLITFQKETNLPVAPCHSRGCAGRSCVLHLVKTKTHTEPRSAESVSGHEAPQQRKLQTRFSRVSCLWSQNNPPHQVRRSDRLVAASVCFCIFLCVCVCVCVWSSHQSVQAMFENAKRTQRFVWGTTLYEIKTAIHHCKEMNKRPAISFNFH